MRRNEPPPTRTLQLAALLRRPRPAWRESPWRLCAYRPSGRRAAASISSFGAAASTIASAAFMESSEIPPKGERAAACIWNNETFTKSLDVVPRALFSRRHQCLAVRRMDFCQLAIRPQHLETGGTRRWPATGVGELFGPGQRAVPHTRPRPPRRMPPS